MNQVLIFNERDKVEILLVGILVENLLLEGENSGIIPIWKIVYLFPVHDDDDGIQREEVLEGRCLKQTQCPKQKR